MPTRSIGRSAEPVVAINAPSSLTAVEDGGYSRIDLEWTDNSLNEDGFRIYRSPNAIGYSAVGTVVAGITSYTDTDLDAGQQYWYRVKAYKDDTESSWSNTATATTFIPTDVPNMRGWHRIGMGMFKDVAGTIPAIVHGDRVARWEDQSGNGHHGTDAANGPILRSIGNGKTALEFYDAHLSLPLALAANDWTVVASMESTAMSGAGRYLVDSQTGRLIFAPRAGSGNPDNIGWYDGAWHDFGLDTHGWQILAWVLEQATNGDILLDDVSIGTAAYAQVAFGGTTMLGSIYSGLTNDVETAIRQFMLFTGAVSAANLTLLYEYLSGDANDLITSEQAWYPDDWLSQTGHILARYMFDTNGDGDKELISNVGNRADFVAYTEDGTQRWRTTINATQHVGAYYPKVYNDRLYYGDRDADKVYCIRMADGVKEWESGVLTDLVCMTTCDKGIAVGYGTNVDILDYSTGNSIGGNWPVAVGMTVHEQCLSAGDLDGDGNDEIVCNDNTGQVKVIEHDGSSILFTITSNHTHSDEHYIYDVDGDSNAELVTVVDDDNSEGGSEGDEIVIYSAAGVQKDKYTAMAGGLTIAVGNIGTAGKIAFAAEGSDLVGILNGDLDLIWSESGTPAAGSTGQIDLLDIDGDGRLEVLTNTAENVDAAIRVHDADDGTLLAWIKGRGWDFDPPMDMPTGMPLTGTDFDGDGYDEALLSRSMSNETAVIDAVFLIGWKHD